MSTRESPYFGERRWTMHAKIIDEHPLANKAGQVVSFRTCKEIHSFNAPWIRNQTSIKYVTAAWLTLGFLSIHTPVVKCSVAMSRMAVEPGALRTQENCSSARIPLRVSSHGSRFRAPCPVMNGMKMETAPTR
ncbi:hypothetical protein Mapa_014235 [Marchantia paleacea]|nr:hypothetical protein Mapa_014235 [Marchantia paleacea]